MKKDDLFRASAFLFLLLFIGFWIWNPTFSEDAKLQNLWIGCIRRLLGSGVFLSVLLFRGFRVFGKTENGSWKYLFPAFAVALNNLPWFSFLMGEVALVRQDLLVVYTLEAVSIGLFEELAFRGVLFPVLIERYATTSKRLIWMTVVSSAAFGLIHLLNLLEGAGAGATLLQVGYSFLIGGMCAIVLLKTHNLFWCILLHGIYDFCGGLIPHLGKGRIWIFPTVAVTAVVGIAVAFWMLRGLFSVKKEEGTRLLP